MGKHEVCAPKYIAKKIKAKGLQKLRLYCQMSEKQCHDENGFRCHMTSESHQRQLLLFADNADRYINNFSKEFERDYLEVLKHEFGTKRVHANRVYQHYISDRHHLHMTSTKWDTLTDFVKWLGREGKCKVDEGEEGWFVQHVDRDPETTVMQEAVSRKEKIDRDDQEMMMAFIEKQIEKGKESSKNDTPVFTEFVRRSEQHIVVNLKVERKRDEDMKNNILVASNALKNGSSAENKKDSRESGRRRGEKRKLSALGEIIKDEENERERINRKDYWLVEGIVVKVMAKCLGDEYHRKKGVVATVCMLDSGHKLKLDQEHLEMVIPAIGRPVRVVNGAYRVCSAMLRELDQKKFCVTIEISSGPLKGRIVDKVEYADICKLYNVDM
ncbi:DNA/RNA-binding protein KIN17 [Cryptotermes secundus]|uniref:DNA/RNA-binding protein KIN17 n=1 Tax=Cryptotermes secundus TaxID=105785 RepID=A0A2J7PPJ8_9NEOP|nr:DNA/RNA-binding protein KIN17 [Cryptotermes secundus]